MLLESQVSNLEELNFSNNSIDSEDASNLINALVNNTKLKTLNLKNNGWITNEGWASILRCLLQLVCDTSSISNIMNSNHTLSSLAEPYDSSRVELMEALLSPLLNDIEAGPRQSFFNRSLGVNRANLLRASLGLNFGAGSYLLKARYKILMLHIRGDLNLGDASIGIGIMPRAIESIGHNWNAIYRILRTRPELCLESRPAEELRMCQVELAQSQ